MGKQKKTISREQAEKLLQLTTLKTRAAMARRGVTAAQLVTDSGLGRTTVYNFLACHGSPRLVTLCAIADALGVHPRTLLPTLKELRQ